MDSAFFQSDRTLSATPDEMVERVVNDARRSYDDIDEDTLSLWAENAVTELWGDSVKVTSFLPVLALRKIATQVNEYRLVDQA